MTDPLGVTSEARERGLQQAELDVLRDVGAKLLADIRDNLARMDAVPDGTEIWCRCCQRTHPVEAFR